MLASATLSPWWGVLWFGFFTIIGLGGALATRRQLADGRIHRAGEKQQRIGMWLGFVVGLVALALTLRELARAVF